MNYWFKPRRHGFGTTPANWKGWLVSFGFMAVVVAFLTILVALRRHLSLEFFAVWAVAFVGVELIFILIAWRKTDGALRWRSNGTGK